MSKSSAADLAVTAEMIETTNDAVTAGVLNKENASTFLADSAGSDSATMKAKNNALKATSAAVKSGALSLNDADSMLTNMSKSSAADLAATANIIESASTSFASGDVSAEEFQKLSSNMAAVAKTSAAVTASGGTVDADFSKNLIKNSENAEDIGNTDFSDPNAVLLVSLKAEFPKFSKFIDANKDDSLGLSILLTELDNLDLSDSELIVVLTNLQNGPQATAPESLPAGVSELTLEGEVPMLSLLQDLSIEGQIDKTMFMAADKALASVFFQDLESTYEALSSLGKSVESSESDVPGAMIDHDEKVLGGKTISIAEGTYSLGDSTSTFDFLIAATDKLTLLGNIVFNAASADSSLILLSAQNVDLSGATSITFTGEELGIGSFDSLNVENVDLKAEGAISLRSLDNIVINNSKMETSGKGADFVHLLAANQITADSVMFSAMIKQITMEAMTINLSNINFPSNSNVNLNSLYGGVEGKYPNFGAVTQYGRVNFIQNMSYGANAIMDKTNFNLHGGNIKIGTIGK